MDTEPEDERVRPTKEECVREAWRIIFRWYRNHGDREAGEGPPASTDDRGPDDD